MDNEQNPDISRYFEPRRVEHAGLQLLAGNLSRIFAQEHCKEAASNKRKQNSWALAAIASFLEANEFPHYIVHRFLDTGLGLGRLDYGEIDDWLNPGPSYQHRHVDSPSLWRARAYAAIALEFLAEDTPGSLEEQATLVANRYSEAIPDEKNCTSAAVKKWRERFKKGDVQDAHATAIFENRKTVIERCRYALEKAGGAPSVSYIATVVLSQIL